MIDTNGSATRSGKFVTPTRLAQKAEAASEAKSRFLATVSHEVRTPLNGILGIAELLGGTAMDREQLAYVEAVKTSGRALATLIDEILDFSRIEAGKLELSDESFDLAALVEGIVELLAPRAQDKGLEIATLLAPDLPAEVRGDPIRLRQVLTNLAGNAIKFTARGWRRPRWSSRHRPGESASRSAIRGPGSGQTGARPSFRNSSRPTERPPASMAGRGSASRSPRRIVELMGGTLTLKDRAGGGSIFGFDVVLPAVGPALRPAWAEPRRPPRARRRRFAVPGPLSRRSSVGRRSVGQGDGAARQGAR